MKTEEKEEDQNGLNVQEIEYIRNKVSRQLKRVRLGRIAYGTMWDDSKDWMELERAVDGCEM